MLMITRESEVCGLRIDMLADADPQNFLDLRTVNESLVDEDLRHGLTRFMFLDECISF